VTPRVVRSLLPDYAGATTETEIDLDLQWLEERGYVSLFRERADEQSPEVVCAAKITERGINWLTDSNPPSDVNDHESGEVELPPASAVIAVLLTGEGTAVGTPPGFAMHRAGAQLRQIVVVVPRSWVKGDHSFSITKQDLADMQRNFEKRKNDMIVIDYELASE
jgi:hypothetical protein